MRGVGEGERDGGCVALAEIPVGRTVGAEPTVCWFGFCEMRWRGEYVIQFGSCCSGIARSRDPGWECGEVREEKYAPVASSAARYTTVCPMRRTVRPTLRPATRNRPAALTDLMRGIVRDVEERRF